VKKRLGGITSWPTELSFVIFDDLFQNDLWAIFDWLVKTSDGDGPARMASAIGGIHVTIATTTWLDHTYNNLYTSRLCEQCPTSR
jgi:hypothetical protein